MLPSHFRQFPIKVFEECVTRWYLACAGVGTKVCCRLFTVSFLFQLCNVLFLSVSSEAV